MRKALAYLFKTIFRCSPIRNTYYGFYNKLFKPFQLFKEVIVPYTFHHHIQLELHIDDWIQAHLFFLDVYENKELLFIEKTLKPHDTFLDIGGHIGLFSLLASKLVGLQGQVITFEPTTKNRNHLIKHKKLNECNNIIIEPFAVCNERKQITLYLDSTEQNSGMVSAFATSHDSSETLQALDLDSYIESNQLDRIDFIKMDIEGSEYDAIIGMQKLLQQFKPTLLIEINPTSTHGVESIENILFPLGYKTCYLNDAGEIIAQRSKYDNSHNYVFQLKH